MSDDTIERLADRLAIDDLLTGYANALDDRDWPAFATLFTPDATLDFTAAYGIAGRRDEIVAWLEQQVRPDVVADMQHCLTNRSCRIEGDAASGRVDFLNPDVFVGADGHRSLLFNGGRYRFTATRTREGWRLTELIGSIVWSQRGELTTFDPPAT